MATRDKRIEKFRRLLVRMDARLRGDVESLEDQARAGVGGDLSGTPMHLADLGTEQYLQELNATLLENEEFLRVEVRDALRRCEAGTFGRCERCEVEVAEERLEYLPYTRYCTKCSAEVADGAAADMNVGRPESGLGGFERRHMTDGQRDASGLEDRDQPYTDAGASHRHRPDDDIHAAGTAGGGTAIGGLAGTNLGEGDPDDGAGSLEHAMGSGKFDQDLDDDHEDTTSYSGLTGGAVGGAIADLRASGGKTHGGLKPRDQ